MSVEDPELAIKFANTVLEELALLRAELMSQRKLITELLSLTTKEPRRSIRQRLYRDRLKGPFDIARALKERVGLPEPKEWPKPPKKSH
jgi:hypothetical protein